jgi:hypothetical protein
MSSLSIPRLRAVNRNLDARLVRLIGGPNRPASIAPTEFTALLAELLPVADCLRGVAAAGAPDMELANEISKYRNNLEKLERLLPWIQGRLLVEKARLQTLQSHIIAAKAWAQASRETL